VFSRALGVGVITNACTCSSCSVIGVVLGGADGLELQMQKPPRPGL
jgi:hypothetical protein